MLIMLFLQMICTLYARIYGELRIDEAIGLESGDIKLKCFYCCFAIPIFAFEFD